MSRCKYFVLSIGVILGFSWIESVHAENRIVVHPPRPTRDTFSSRPNLSLNEFLKALEIEQDFHAQPEELMKEALEFVPTYEVKVLPACSVSQNRKEKIAIAPQTTLSRFGYIFYSSEVPADKKNAEKFGGVAVAYKAGEHRLDDASVDPRAKWAALVQVKCLPTKIYFSQDPQGTYVIYAEGSNAWKKEE